jgi:hypothetical protein
VQESFGSSYNSYGGSYGSSYGQQPQYAPQPQYPPSYNSQYNSYNSQSSTPYGYDQNNIDQQAQNLRRDICQNIIEMMKDIPNEKKGNIESYKNAFDDVKSSFGYQNQSMPRANPSQIIDDLWKKISSQAKNLSIKDYMMMQLYKSLTPDEKKEAESGIYDINDKALLDFMGKNPQAEIPRGKFLAGVFRVLWNADGSQQYSSSQNPRDLVIQGLRNIMQKVPIQHPLYNRLQSICDECSKKSAWLVKHYFHYSLNILSKYQDLLPLKFFTPVEETKKWLEHHENIKSSPYIAFKPEDTKDNKDTDKKDSVTKEMNNLQKNVVKQGTDALTKGLANVLGNLFQKPVS